MKLIIISAVSMNGIIGIDSEIPWVIPEDFKHYKQTTMGHIVVVGLNTFKTLPEKALEGRTYFVLSDDNMFETDKDNVHLFKTLKELTDYILLNCIDEEIYIAGGAMIYDQLIDICSECIITWVDRYVEYDRHETPKYFPCLKLHLNFKEVVSTEWLNSKAGINYQICKYKRI